jgi:hypothetical protein
MNPASADVFSLSSLSFYINDEAVAALVKKEQPKSFLKAGGPLSLALISEEKDRLKNLLEKNGYDNLNSQAITFVMDTSAANHSFSVQVNIQLEKNINISRQTYKNITGAGIVEAIASRTGDQEMENVPVPRSQLVKQPAGTNRSVVMQ